MLIFQDPYGRTISRREWARQARCPRRVVLGRHARGAFEVVASWVGVCSSQEAGARRWFLVETFVLEEVEEGVFRRVGLLDFWEATREAALGRFADLCGRLDSSSEDGSLPR